MYHNEEVDFFVHAAQSAGYPAERAASLEAIGFVKGFCKFIFK